MPEPTVAELEIRGSSAPANIRCPRLARALHVGLVRPLEEAGLEATEKRARS